MKRIEVGTFGLPMSERLLIGGFVELVALTDGHVFRLCDFSDAPIVICNPANTEAAALLSHPKPGVAYIQYGMPECSYGQGVWCLSLPVRLAALREIMIAIVEQRSAWLTSGALTLEVSAAQNLAALPVPAHRKLEHVLRQLGSILQSQVPHSFVGIKGVKITVFPQLNVVYIQCESGIDSWQKALATTSQRVSIFSRMDAKRPIELQPISIAHFRWELARHLSAGMLLPGLASRLEFGLTRWPDFGTMAAGSAYDLKIVALIATRSTSIVGILKTVPYTLEGVIALLNGCALVGCLRDAPADLLRNVAIQEPLSALFAMRTPEAPVRATLTLAAQAPQRGFLGMLSKLRAALSYVPRSNA